MNRSSFRKDIGEAIAKTIRLLDPKTAIEALAEIEYYAGFSGKEVCIKAIEDACRIAISATNDESCDECRFFNTPVDEYPCSHCCHCYISKFQPKSGD